MRRCRWRRSPDKQLELVPGALADARVFLENKADTQARFERVSDLVEGSESSFGLALLTTVHWIANEEKTMVSDDIVKHTYAWSKRKKQFSQRQIKLAFDVLSEKSSIEHLDVRGTAHLHDTVPDSPEEANDEGCNP